MEKGMIFVLMLVGISTAGWLINNLIRAKHGYALENEWKGQTPKVNPDDQRTIELLTNENERQAGQITRLEERLAVLERIVTDPAVRVASDIEALR
jgi:hypothetical protein